MRYLLFLLIFFTVQNAYSAGVSGLKAGTGVTNIKSDYMKYNFKKKRTIFLGNVRLTRKNLIITADTVIETDKKITAFGRIHYLNTRDNIKAQARQAVYRSDTQDLVLTGQPQIESKKDTFTISADTIVILVKARNAFFYKNVKIKKGGLTGRGGYARYDDKSRAFNLYDSPVVTKGKDVFISDTISVDLHTNEVEMLGNVRGKIYRVKKSGRLKDAGTKTK